MYELMGIMASIQVRDEFADSLGIAGDLQEKTSGLVDFDEDDPTGSSDINEDKIINSALASSGEICVEITGDDEDDDDAFQETSVDLCPGCCLHHTNFFLWLLHRVNSPQSSFSKRTLTE